MQRKYTVALHISSRFVGQSLLRNFMNAIIRSQLTQQDDFRFVMTLLKTQVHFLTLKWERTGCSFLPHYLFAPIFANTTQLTHLQPKLSCCDIPATNSFKPAYSAELLITANQSIGKVMPVMLVHHKTRAWSQDCFENSISEVRTGERHAVSQKACVAWFFQIWLPPAEWKWH